MPRTKKIPLLKSHFLSFSQENMYFLSLGQNLLSRQKIFYHYFIFYLSFITFLPFLHLYFIISSSLSHHYFVLLLKIISILSPFHHYFIISIPGPSLLERVPQVHGHLLKFGNRCRAPVLIRVHYD